MIDWVSTGFSALWISGLGFVTAALSFAYYLAGLQKWKFRQALEIPTIQVWIDIGLVLFCVGQAGSELSSWERVVWAILALMFAVQTWQARKQNNS